MWLYRITQKPTLLNPGGCKTGNAQGTVRIYDLSQDGGNVLSEAQAHQAPVVGAVHCRAKH